MPTQKPEWPMNLEDPVRALHFALEKPECPHVKPESCPVEKQVARTLELHGEWRTAQADIALARLVERAATCLADANPSRLDYFNEIYREAYEAGAPQEIMTTLERMREKAGGKP